MAKTSMIKTTLALLEALEREATAGPWRYPGEDEDNNHLITCGKARGAWTYVDTSAAPSHKERANAVLITEARNTLTSLIAEVRLLHAAMRRMHAWSCLCDDCHLLRPDRELGKP